MAMKEQKSRKMESSTPMYPFINPLRPRNNSQIIVYHNKPYSLNVFSFILHVWMEQYSWVSEYNFMVLGSLHLDHFGSHLKGRQTALCHYVTHRWQGSFLIPVVFNPSQFFGNTRNLLVTKLKSYLRCNSMPWTWKYAVNCGAISALMRWSLYCEYMLHARNCTLSPLFHHFSA